MTIKDSVVSWYVKNYIMPRAQIFDIPGFIIFNVSKTEVYSRQILLPESFFVAMEKGIIDKFGRKGKQLLYSAGKKFGYRFALVANSQNITEMPQDKFLDYLKVMFKFIEGTYASKIELDVDISKPLVKFYLKNFVICEKSGEGYFLTRGGAAGLCARLFNNKNMEIVQIKCQGKGDDGCVLICAPPKLLERYKSDLFEENTLGDELGLEGPYKEINKMRYVVYSNRSFKDLLDSSMFSYKQGIVMMGNERYFIIESSVLYILEMELNKNAKIKNLLHDIAYSTFFDIGRNFSSIKEVMDILTAFGFGDVLVIEKGSKVAINIRFFPWTKFYTAVDFIIFRGFLEGILSSVLKRTVKLKKTEKDLSNDNFSLHFAE